MQLESFLEASARQWPEKTALVCGATPLDVCRTGGGGQPAGPRPAGRGSRARRPRGDLPGKRRRGGALDLRDPQGGRRVPDGQSDHQGRQAAFILNNSRAAAVVVPAGKLAALGRRATRPSAPVIAVGTGYPRICGETRGGGDGEPRHRSLRSGWLGQGRPQHRGDRLPSPFALASRACRLRACDACSTATPPTCCRRRNGRSTSTWPP